MSYGKGTICGQVIGDVHGPSTEGMTEEKISQKYPNGITHYSDIFQDRHRRRWKIGDWPDDTDMMRCILDTFVACLKDDTFDIARRFKEWMMNGGMGIDRHIFHVGKIFGYGFSVKGFILYTFECIFQLTRIARRTYT